MAPNTYPHHPPPQHQQPQQQQGHPGQQQQQQQGQGPGQGQGQGGPPGQQPNAQHLAQQQHAMMMMGRMPMNVVNGVQQIPPGGGGGGQGPPHQQGHPGGGGGPPGGPGQQQQQGIPQGLMGMHAGMTPSQVQVCVALPLPLLFFSLVFAWSFLYVCFTDFLFSLLTIEFFVTNSSYIE